MLTMYDKMESCINRVKPCRVKKPLLANREVRTQIEMYKDNFSNTHGMVKNRFLFYINKAEYDSRFFKAMLKMGKESKDEKDK